MSKISEGLLFSLLGAATLYGQTCVSQTADFASCKYNCQYSGGPSCSCGVNPNGQRGALRRVPGFMFEQRSGHFVVTNVVPGSPADKVGVQPGDVVLRLNGRSIVENQVGYADKQWGEQVTKVVLQRGAEVVEKVVPLVSNESLLDLIWEGPVQGPVGSIVGQVPRQHTYSPFLWGFELSRHDAHWVVSGILRRGAAERAGVRLGDVVIGAKSSDPYGRDVFDISSIPFYLDHRGTVELTLSRGSGAERLTFSADALSEAVRGSALIPEDHFYGLQTLSATKDLF